MISRWYWTRWFLVENHWIAGFAASTCFDYEYGHCPLIFDARRFYPNGKLYESWRNRRPHWLCSLSLGPNNLVFFEDSLNTLPPTQPIWAKCLFPHPPTQTHTISILQWYSYTWPLRLQRRYGHRMEGEEEGGVCVWVSERVYKSTDQWDLLSNGATSVSVVAVALVDVVAAAETCHTKMA